MRLVLPTSVLISNALETSPNAACQNPVFMATDFNAMNPTNIRPQDRCFPMLANIATAKPSSYLRNPHHGSSLGFWLSQRSMLYDLSDGPPRSAWSLQLQSALPCRWHMLALTKSAIPTLLFVSLG
jgi:hypothetical protein